MCCDLIVTGALPGHDEHIVKCFATSPVGCLFHATVSVFGPYSIGVLAFDPHFTTVPGFGESDSSEMLLDKHLSTLKRFKILCLHCVCVCVWTEVLKRRHKYLPMFNEPEWEEVLMCNRGSDP